MATIHETGIPPRNTTISGNALPPLEAEAQEIIAKAGRSAPMLLAFRELVKNPTAIESIGYPVAMARAALVGLLASKEPAIAASALAHCEREMAKLLADCGPNPSFAEWMAAMRVVNNWLTVHALEALVGLNPSDGAPAAALDKRVTQAEKRLHAALKSLAVLRRLRKPAAATQVNIAKGGPMVVNNTAPVGKS